MIINDNFCSNLALKLRNKEAIIQNFQLKNIKLAKEIWKETIKNDINQNISFIDYSHDDNCFKVKYSYLEHVEKILELKISMFGFAEKIIEIKDKYTITSLSLSNFIKNNYYSEEIINALLCLYQSHARSQGYIIFNTFSYFSVYNLINNYECKCTMEIALNDIRLCKGIVFPILISSPINEFIWVIANPNEK